MRGLNWRIWRLILAIGVGWSLAGEAAELAQNQANRPESATAKPSTAREEEPTARGHQAIDNAATAFFAGPIQYFDIRIASDKMNSLRQQPRLPVPATLRIGTNVFTKVAVHVKGAAGSTRSIDDNPALTISLDKWVSGQRFSGLDKFHLNNSVQDYSLLNESVASFLYLRAGVPTARSTHGVVTLNGRDLGVYVLKEGYNRSFLRRNYGSSSGNLYDGGFVQDIDRDLERDVGDGEDTHDDLHQLVAAVRTSDPIRRRALLEKQLEVKRFVAMAVIQGFTCDWDGYAQHHNNYRVFWNATTGRVNFIPHGMDQLFEDGYRDVAPGWAGMVADAVFSDPTWNEEFWTQMEALVAPGLEDVLKKHFATVHQRLDPVLAKRPDEERSRRGAMFEKERAIMARIAQVREQVSRHPKPVEFGASGWVSIGKWEERPGSGEVGFKLLTAKTGEQWLRLEAEQRASSGSWRTRMHLFPGRYVYSARVRTARVDPNNSDRMAGGAGIRISGSQPGIRLKGDTEWQAVNYEFELTEARDVEFVAELRAHAGEAIFDLSAMKLRKL